VKFPGLLGIRVDIAMSALLSAIHKTGHYHGPTERRVLVALLRPICKQRPHPPQLRRPGFGLSGEHEPPKSRHNAAVLSARNGARCAAVAWRKSVDRSDTPHEARKMHDSLPIRPTH
jgi:hypothetical protein